MKRLVTILATALLLTAALCVSASAADYTPVAEDLSTIGMFRGTVNGGFELDRAPKRSEAAIMLVRLYGAEEQAAAAYKNGEISHPFKDVGSIAAPYVAWLYTNGITKGTTDTTFSSNAVCSDKNYVVFLLRALGYQDGVDFQYADALTFAEQLGFYQDSVYGDGFLRDDLAAITLQALATDKKGGETYLLKSLIASGAVDAAKAKPLTEKIEAYRALMARSAAMPDLSAVSASFSGTVRVDSTSTGKLDSEDYTTSSSLILAPTGSLTVIQEPLQAAFNAKLAMTSTEDGLTDRSTIAAQLWLKDGWLYLRSDDGAGTVTSVKYNANEIIGLIRDALAETETSNSTVSYALLPMTDAITLTRSGSDTVCTITMDRYLATALGEDDGSYTDEDGIVYTDKLNSAKLAIHFTVGANGQFKSMQVSAKSDSSSSVQMDQDNYLTDRSQMDLNLTITLSTGSSIRISYPDFSQFVEITRDDLGF